MSHSQATLKRRNVRLARTVLAETWLSVSSVTRTLRRRGQAVVVGRPERELRLGNGRRPPVMLVHGLAADKSCFTDMAARLHRAGYTVYSVSYPCVRSDVAECARHLEREAAWLLEVTGADRLHVVAHSLGGVVLRWAAAHTGLGELLGVCVTLGSPHRGTPTANLAPARLPGFGTIVSQLRPGALPIDDGSLHRRADARWVALAGEYDVVVPARYAHLPPSRRVRNAVVAGAGHMTLTRSASSLAIILEELGAGMALPPQGHLDPAAAESSTLCA